MSFGLQIVGCTNCGFVQTEPVPDVVLTQYYSKYYRQKWPAGAIEVWRKQSRAQARSQIEYIEEMLGSCRFSTALDYGTADGELPRLLKARCDLLYATEADPLYFEILEQEPWLTLLSDDELRSNQYRGRFELVTASHVLEHLPDPGTTLGMFAYLLAPGGILLVDVPNEVRCLKHGFQADGHLHFFTADHLRLLIDRDGFFDLIEIRHCNRSIEEFIASGFTMPEDYSIAKKYDGSTIRALFRNRKHGLKEVPQSAFNEPRADLLESYASRILDLHQRLKKTGSNFET